MLDTGCCIEALFIGDIPSIEHGSKWVNFEYFNVLSSSRLCKTQRRYSQFVAFVGGRVSESVAKPHNKKVQYLCDD